MLDVLSPEQSDDDASFKSKYKPQVPQDFIGQEAVVNPLWQAKKAATDRGLPLDHVLLAGSPGLGKSVLARLVAENATTLHCAVIKNADELVILLRRCYNQGAKAIILEEAHSLRPRTAEVLYPIIDEGTIPGWSTYRFSDLCLIAVTTDVPKLPEPLRDRFEIQCFLELYSEDELSKILTNYCKKQVVGSEEKAIIFLAKRGRGSPRITLRLMRRTLDYGDILTLDRANQAMQAWGIDDYGLGRLDRKYMELLEKRFKGGPVGLSTISQSMVLPQQTVTTVVEPFLIRSGLVAITTRGRMSLR